MRVTEIVTRPMDVRHKLPRVYFFPQGAVLLNLPEAEYVKACRKLLPEVAKRLDIKIERAGWDWKAGCSVCFCSPGFIISVGTATEDIFVNVDDELALKAEKDQALYSKEPEMIAGSQPALTS